MAAITERLNDLIPLLVEGTAYRACTLADLETEILIREVQRRIDAGLLDVECVVYNAKYTDAMHGIRFTPLHPGVMRVQVGKR